LNILNVALGSAGELFSGMYSFKEINKITEDKFEKFDELHYQVENELISLIKSLQQKWSLRHPASAGQTKEGRMARLLHRKMKNSNFPIFHSSGVSI